MNSTLQILVLLLIVIAAVAVAAKRLQTPPAILLVLVGVVLALIPGLPPVILAPNFVLLFVLPLIVYSSAVAMSWLEFRFNLRPISLLAVGCVLFTTMVTAAITHVLLGFSWSVGFILGAIVSPPDPVAPLSIARRLQLPRRLLVIERAHFVPVRGRGSRRQHIFPNRRRGHLRRDNLRRNTLGHRCRMADA
jgi:monovalent cation/hydrogen antiporter